MAEREYPVEMANLICKFGKKNLLDYFEEIVEPAFSDASLVRKFAETSYFFDSVKVISVSGRALLVGRIIKDTILEREQIYSRVSGLTEDHDKMQSSPSSVFVLVLDIHRLIYLKETKFAPGLDAFRATLENFLKVKYKAFIDDLYDDGKGKTEEGKKITKKYLMAENIPPSLELVPLTSAQDIDSFVRQYEVLSSVVYKFSDRNDEHDNESFFEAVQRQKDEVGSKRTEVRHTNSEGLDKESVIEEVQAATAQGNQTVVLSGKDSSGTILRGDNNNFQLKAIVELISTQPSSAAPKMFAKFLQLVGDGLITVTAPPKRALEKLNRYLGGQNE